MVRSRIQAARKYYLLSCHRYFTFQGSEKYEESLILTLTHEGGAIRFDFTDLSTNDIHTLDNPASGEYEIPLKKGVKTKLVITASKATGAYKIEKRTIED